MKNNIEFNFAFTVSKVCAIAIIILSPIYLDDGMVLSGWIISAGLLGWKQGADALKKSKLKKDE